MEQNNKLQQFVKPEFGTIRTIQDENNETWFVAKDITESLGYANSSKALLDHVDEEDKLNNETLSSLGQRGGWLINESGLYSLIMSSKLPSAKEFKRWVTSEVLPAIRKSGTYSVVPQDYRDAVAALLESLDKQEKLQIENKVQAQQINELKPKADYCDQILKSKSLMTVTQISKDYGMSAKAMNKKLYELGIQYYQSDMWFLYSQYQDKGYTQSETYRLSDDDDTYKGKVVMMTKWTQKGRLFLYELLKKNGVLPTIEKVEETKEGK